MNYLADIIVIGDSKEGHEAVKRLAASKPTIKITFISREFKSKTTHDYLNVEYLKEEVIFIDYKNRLFGCYLKNGNRVFGTHLIIATGVAYEPLLLDDGTLVPCVSNTVNDIAKTAKVQPAVVFGKQNSDVKLAIEVAKKYKYGVAVAAVDWNGVSEKKKRIIDKTTSSIAKKIIHNSGNVKPGIKTKGMFWIMHLMQKNGFNPRDVEYWKAKGWTGKIRPWK